MSDSTHYTEQAQAFSRKAASAATPQEADGYIALAGAYAQLARDAAQYEAQWGRSLTAEVA
jgi:hypothetical protein